MNKTEWVKRSLIQGQLIVIWYKLSYQPNQFVDLGCKKYSLVLKSEGILYAAWPIFVAIYNIKWVKTYSSMVTYKRNHGSV